MLSPRVIRIASDSVVAACDVAWQARLLDMHSISFAAP